MRKLTIEYTAFDYKDKMPSESFFKELSKQLTNGIASLIDDELLRDNLARLICIRVEPNSYMSPRFQDGLNSMRMDLSAFSAPLVICRLIVYWRTNTNCRLNPWNEYPGNGVYFDFQISESEIKKLNAIMPELYHPVIKPETSGLPYEYQIYHGGDTLVLYYNRQISQDDVNEAERTLNAYIEEADKRFVGVVVRYFEAKKTSKTQIKIYVDFGAVGADETEKLIQSFRHHNGIRKIVLH